MSIRTKILEKGKIIQEQLIRVLLNFDDRISALENGGTGGSVSIEDLDDAELVEIVVTYPDETTETVKAVIQKSE